MSRRVLSARQKYELGRWGRYSTKPGEDDEAFLIKQALEAKALLEEEAINEDEVSSKKSEDDEALPMGIPAARIRKRIKELQEEAAIENEEEVSDASS